MKDDRTRVVVVGYGMVGSRFVEDLLDRDPQGRVAVTVLGAEAYQPYNRVLLSELVAGAVDVATLALGSGDHPRAVVHPGTSAVAVDRAGRLVLASDGRWHPYDVLVLATGSSARILPLPGMDPMPAGVHPLRTLDDAREIVAATMNAHRAVVVGGGVLGLEVATGLRKRGLCVSLVHGAPHLMERQLDAEAAGVVADGLERLGIAVRTGTFTTHVEVDDGRVTGVGLGDEVLPAELVVVCAGTVAEVRLARESGLDVERGVVVGEDLATPADPRVFAIGDCAQPPEGGTGLIAQGWDQARRLAVLLAARIAAGGPDAVPAPDADADASPPPHAAGTDLVRLKAHGLDVVAMGVCGPGRRARGLRVVRLTDPDGGRHLEMVVADGRLVGATLVGAGPVGADLTAAYTRATPLPADPATLLMRPVAGLATPAPSPTLMPDRTTVCRCNGVTKKDVVTCWRGGADTVAEVARGTRATTGCGGCTDVVSGILAWLATTDPDRRRASVPPGAPADETAAGAAPVPEAVPAT